MSSRSRTISAQPTWWRRKAVWQVLGVVTAAVVVLSFLAGRWLKRRLAVAETLTSVMTESAHADPGRILEQVNHSYQGMSPEQRQAALADPATVSRLFAEMTATEMRRSLTPVFALPKPVRRRIFEESAASIRKNAQMHSETEIAEFLDSPTGEGMLRGLTQYFILELNGKQKAETAALADEIFKQIARSRKAR